MITLIILLAMAFAGAGAFMLIARATGRRPPSYAIAAAAGAAMLGYGIWSEYTWFERMSAALPAGAEVVSTASDASFLQPWAYVFPRVSRFAALNLAAARRNDRLPGYVIADMLIFARFTTPIAIPVIVDCAGRRRAPLIEVDVDALQADSLPADLDWRAADGADPVIDAACADANPS